MILHYNSLALSNRRYICLFLCDFLDLHITPVEQNIIDSGRQDGEREVDTRIEQQFFEDEDNADDVLEEEKRFS